MDKSFLKWFGGGFGAAFGVATALVVSAAPGDAVYEDVQEPAIYKDAAKTALESAFVTHGAWTGDAKGILACSAVREEDGLSYKVICRGLKVAKAAELPDRKVTIIGRASSLEEATAKPVAEPIGEAVEP